MKYSIGSFPCVQGELRMYCKVGITGYYILRMPYFPVGQIKMKIDDGTLSRKMVNFFADGWNLGNQNVYTRQITSNAVYIGGSG